VGSEWRVDRCRDCGGVRPYGPHEPWECLRELLERVEALSERVEYLSRAIGHGNEEDD